MLWVVFCLSDLESPFSCRERRDTPQGTEISRCRRQDVLFPQSFVARLNSFVEKDV